MTASPETSPPLLRGLGFRQFVGLIAALMAVNALAIDSMLPALPVIGRAMHMSGANQEQWIVTAYLLGFGSAQIIYGTLADRFGRKPILLFGLVMYLVFSIMAALAGSLPVLITARVLQGIGAAATRVLAISIVRDCYSGSQMARVMSLSYIVFLAVPILAPSLGQLLMLVGPWRWIFGALALLSLALTIWTAKRLPETLNPADRLPIQPGRILAAFRLTVTNQIAVGYMLAMTLMMGALFGFINSAQPIFAVTFAAPRLFSSVFALIAGCMAVSSLLNSRIVGRFGPRRVSHAAILGFISCGILHAGVALSGAETIWSFGLLQGGVMFCFGMVVSNFGALAMGPLGHVAGTASSVQGFVTTLGGAVLGFLIGQRFDGSTLPLTIGLSLCGMAALAIVVFAEGGRLFRSSAPVLVAEGERPS